MKTITVSAAQPRVANEGKTTTTTLYAIEVDGDYVEVFYDDLSKYDIPAGFFKVVAIVDVEHPAIMWGNMDELMINIRNIAERALKDNGIRTLGNKFMK